MSFLSARRNAGLSQVEVAKHLGVDSSAVCLWETGKTKPTVDRLLRLAELYRCTVDELLRKDQPS